MKIRFLGVGAAFAPATYYQSNMLISNGDDNLHLLLDCGGDVRFALADNGITPENLHAAIDAVYISHLHADHVGGLEWLAFNAYFGKVTFKPKLFAETSTLYKLWEHSLKGGLDCIDGKMMHITDYFDCQALPVDGSFRWHGLDCRLMQMPHVLNGYKNHYSYGLVLQAGPRGGAFITTDSRLQVETLVEVAPQVECIFHDCETSGVKSGVHAHYEELCTLPAAIKQKMWLYHYQPHPPYEPVADGFQGFVKKGQTFILSAAGT